MPPEDQPTPQDELLSPFEVLTYKIHWIVLHTDQDEGRVDELEAIYDRLGEDTATDQDEERFHDIADSVWNQYDKILKFERLDIVPDDNPEVADLVERMVFLAIIDHITERETVPFESDRKDVLEYYLELAEEFLADADTDFPGAFEDLDQKLGDLEEAFLQKYYFEDGTLVE